MDPDQAGWYSNPQLPPDWVDAAGGEWGETDPKRAARQAEIELRVTEQRLNTSLGPSLQAFGLSSALEGAGGSGEAPPLGQTGVEEGQRMRQPSKDEHWSYGVAPTTDDSFTHASAFPLPPQQPFTSAFPAPQLPYRQAPSATPSYQYPPASALPVPSPHQEQLPEWLYQAGPLPATPTVQGGAVVSGMGLMRAASSDYGQPQHGAGGALPYSYGVPNPHRAPLPSPSTALPPFPPPPPQQYGMTAAAPPPTDAQPHPYSAQALFKQHIFTPQPDIPKQVGEQQQQQQRWSTPLGTPQTAYSPVAAQHEQAAAVAPSYFPPAAPGTLCLPPSDSATALPLAPANLTLDFGFPHLGQQPPPVPQLPSSSFAPPGAVNPLPSRPPYPSAELSQVAASSSTLPQPPPSVDFAASNEALQASAPKRSRTGSKAASTSKPSLSNAPQAAAVEGKPGKKLTVDLATSCLRCSKPIGRLILRGKANEINVPHAAVFTCSDCAAIVNSPASVGSPLSDAPPPSKSKAKKDKAPTYRKKNKRLDDHSSLTACDVCLRDVAVGGVLPAPVDNPPPGARIDFMIEVVCVSCDAKYRRCTDCGGGGGTRAGTGKWRCKELFLEGRKTCCLSHQRLGAFPDMCYDVWNIRDIPADEVDDLSERCGRIFTNQMLAGLCIPEVLEQDGAIYTSFEMAEARARLGWKGFDPMLRNDIEHTSSIRRYLALRTCTPNRRKTTKQQKEDEEAAEARKLKKENPVVLPVGKEIAGYIVAEWEIKLGHVFLAIVIPWDPTGETFDATTLLIGALMRRVDEDIREMNVERQSRGQPPVPGLLNVWTMLFFKKESRMLSHLIKKRDFLFIDDFLQKYPSTDPQHFPPHRPCYIPVDRQAGWQILIRRQKTYNDGRFDDWNARRAVDEERGKKKEAKARAARAAREEQLRG